MDREQFIQEFLQKLPERVSGNLQYLKKGMASEEMELQHLIRETNIKYFKTESDEMLGDFFVLEPADVPTQYCRFEGDYLFSEYEKEGWEGVWNIVDDNVEMVRRIAENDVMKLLNDNDYQALKDHLFIRPLNYADHRYELDDKVYRRIGDMALVLYLLLEDTDDGECHNVSSAKMYRVQTQPWNVSEDEIWEAAMGNTYLMAPPRMYKKAQDTYKPPYQKGAFMALGSKLTSLSAYDVPILTTTSQTNGAIALFYPGVKEKIAEMFGDDYYVAFTSIHEARLHRKDTVSPIQVLRQIKALNKLDPTDILTRKLYLYERVSGELKQLEL